MAAKKIPGGELTFQVTFQGYNCLMKGLFGDAIYYEEICQDELKLIYLCHSSSRRFA